MKLLTSEQAGACLGITVQEVGAWVRDGRIPEGAYVRTPGGRYRFHPAHIRMVLNQRRKVADAGSLRVHDAVPASVAAHNNRGGRG